MTEGDRFSRRAVLTLVVVALAVTGGCAGLDLGGANDVVNLNSAPSTTLNADAVEQLPSDATVVDATDDGLANVTGLQTLLEKAAGPSEGYASHEVRGENATAAVTRALDDLPFIEDASAYYLRYEGEVYRVHKLGEQ